MPKYVQVCDQDVLEVFEDATLEHVKNDSQEWANMHEVKVIVYEVVAVHEFEPEEEEEEEEEEEDEDGDAVPV